MKTALTQTINHTRLTPLKLFLGIVLAGTLLGFCLHAFADGTDLLSGTLSDATDTIQNSGKKWLYLIEGVAALMLYIKTKNIFVLGGVVVVALFVNIMLHFVQGS